MTDRLQLAHTLDTLLEPEKVRDYGPNGLQVEGRMEIRKLVSGVTASQALIDAAVAAGADAILVHHGLFWRGQDGRVTGWMKKRLATLLAHDVNLFAYHLPLDMHPELGNNAQLARQLGWVASGRFGEQSLGFLGRRADGASYGDSASLGRHLEIVLRRPVTVVPGAGKLRRWPGAPVAHRATSSRR